jgi:hypothetical protein
MDPRSRLDFVADNAVRRDADLSFSMTWRYNGAGIDLTGHVLELKVRKIDSEGLPIGNALITLDNAGNGGITLADQSDVVNGGRGKAYYVMSQARIVGNTSAGRYFYTARDTSTGGITPMFWGYMEFVGPES